MPLGRIDADTTANIGTIAGGTATNVVAERCSITAEARSRDERALSVQLTAMLDALTWAASECEVDLETRVEKEFTAYRLGERDPQVALARRRPRGAGPHAALVASGGGSDVNAFLLNGFPSVNLCNGMIDVHTADERIAVASLEQMVDVTLGLIDAARAARDRRRRGRLGPPIRSERHPRGHDRQPARAPTTGGRTAPSCAAR